LGETLNEESAGSKITASALQLKTFIELSRKIKNCTDSLGALSAGLKQIKYTCVKVCPEKNYRVKCLILFLQLFEIWYSDENTSTSEPLAIAAGNQILEQILRDKDSQCSLDEEI
jgi:hypothetical protein